MATLNKNLPLPCTYESTDSVLKQLLLEGSYKNGVHPCRWQLVDVLPVQSLTNTGYYPVFFFFVVRVLQLTPFLPLPIVVPSLNTLTPGLSSIALPLLHWPIRNSFQNGLRVIWIVICAQVHAVLGMHNWPQCSRWSSL